MSVIERPQIRFTQLFIDNEFRKSINNKKFPTINPSTGDVIAEIEEADKDDVDQAVSAAQKAVELGSEWRTMDASQRGRLLHKLADLMERDADYIATLDTLENGLTITDTRHSLKFGVELIRYYAGWPDKLHGKTIPADGNVTTITRLEPKGVCAIIIPWNAPVVMLSKTIGPALAAGNTVIVKPAEQTSLSALYIASLTKEAGFPTGVFNVVCGYGPITGAALSEHMDVDKITFTGSTSVGKLIQQASGKSNLKSVTLELGGKSPLVIFDDADIDEAVNLAHFAVFVCNGQVCCAGSRTFVQEGIYDQFVKRSVELSAARVVGDPFNTNTVQGPQVNAQQLNKIIELIDSGVKEGAKLETGGKRIGNRGYFVEPTVFSNVSDDMRIAKEEIFGPVQQIIKFKTMDEVIRRSNNTIYGLGSGIVTKSLDNVLTYSQAVKAGTVWVNCYFVVTPQTPIGGYKMSGFGREFGENALYEYIEEKTITIRVDNKNS
ncbi:aldehyde dehydrogenase 1A1-like [Oppia nitens]|uniref:aldehyde dehydrogenase 1A1-like n=1 Tax=Oppia nitens TaxID=1686743 RepID=UPI0023DA84BC|nr:aldehyde dehydrogenase 1A1-like [Oppia nitens]